MKKAIFEGHHVAVGEEHVKQDEFDIDFNGELKARFKHKSGKIICIDAMDGWGDHVQDEYYGKELVLE